MLLTKNIPIMAERPRILPKCPPCAPQVTVPTLATPVSPNPPEKQSMREAMVHLLAR